MIHFMGDMLLCVHLHFINLFNATNRFSD